MPCYRPWSAYQTTDGTIHSSARGTVGKSKWAKAPNYRRELTLPCGRCIGCRLERSRQTAVRLVHEAQLHTKNSFVTLTMTDEYLKTRGQLERPASTSSYSAPAPNAPQRTNAHDEYETRAHVEANSLWPRELQLFTKRLNEDVRRRSSTGVKYYAVGEYGERTGRPHYHAIIFGEDFSDDRTKWKLSNGKQLWRSSRLTRLWPHGGADIGTFNFETAAYVARYVMKKITGPLAKEHYKRTREDGSNYWIHPEFAVMSRGGRTGKGIAHAWFQQYKGDVYDALDAVVINGKTCKPPRYYDKLLEALAPFEMEAIKLERELTNNRINPDNTPDRLAVRETVALARLKQHTRSLE